MKFLLSIFTKNLLLKSMALLMSIMLWAAMGLTITSEATVRIQVDSIRLPERFAADYYITSVKTNVVPDTHFKEGADGLFSGEVSLTFKGTENDLEEAGDFFKNYNWRSIFNFESYFARTDFGKSDSDSVTIDLKEFNNPYEGKIEFISATPEFIILNYVRLHTESNVRVLRGDVIENPELLPAKDQEFSLDRETVTLKAPRALINDLEKYIDGSLLIRTEPVDLTKFDVVNYVPGNRETLRVSLDKRYAHYVAENAGHIEVSFIPRPRMFKTTLSIPVSQVHIDFPTELLEALNEYSYEFQYQSEKKTHLDIEIETAPKIATLLKEKVEIEGIKLFFQIEEEWTGTKSLPLQLGFVDPTSRTAEQYRNGLIRYDAHEHEQKVTATKHGD